MSLYKDITCYRPISLLPTYSKIFEKCMYNRMINYIDKHKILSPFQYGFQKHKSTTDALLSFTERIYNSLDTGNHAMSLFIDLKKAFDTVNHDILSKKLKHYGFRGICLDWFKSYLKNRKQCVIINNVISSVLSVDIGVPQGSILGPLLFFMYINDLPNVSNILSTVLFADDTTYSHENTSYEALVNTLNSELDKIKEWFIINRLSINLNKTFSIVFSNKHFSDKDVTLKFNNTPVNIKNNGKLLGVIIDNKLSFNNHVSFICSKLSKTAGIFVKIHSFIPENIKIKLYYSLVYPYLICGNLVWGACTVSNLNKLLLIQKKIIRYITDQPYLSHSDPLFYRTKILKIQDIHAYLLAIEGYNQFKSQRFNYLAHCYETRNKNNPIPTSHRLIGSQKSLTYSVPVLWNTLPDQVKNAKSLSLFKKRCKDYLLAKYVN